MTLSYTDTYTNCLKSKCCAFVKAEEWKKKKSNKLSKSNISGYYEAENQGPIKKKKTKKTRKLSRFKYKAFQTTE